MTFQKYCVWGERERERERERESKRERERERERDENFLASLKRNIMLDFI